MANDALSTFLAIRQRVATTLFSAEAYYQLVEAAFLLLILYLALTRAYKPRGRTSSTPTMSASERAARLSSWKPEPLSLPLSPSVLSSQPIDISLSSASRPMVTTSDGKELVNLAAHNFLGLVGDPTIESAALRTLSEYGCGACGPRGFYGTTDVHLECEKALAKFCETEHAILYSFGAATPSSTIPAFCKRGDLIIADDAIHFGLQTGVTLSRARVLRFRHNNLGHLEALLKDAVADDAKNPRNAASEKRFIVAEGLYQNVGDIAPLRELVALKRQYNFRLILDESFSLGVLGSTGRGAIERAGVTREDVDICTADLGNALASVGGFCVGAPEVVSHQRLSGAGYCFSASQPPFLATAATKALEILSKKGGELTGTLRGNIQIFRDALQLEKLRENGWVIDGDRESPLMHVRSRREEASGAMFTKIQKECMENGVLVARPMYVPQECVQPKPSVKIAISAAHSRKQLESAAETIKNVLLQFAKSR